MKEARGNQGYSLIEVLMVVVITSIGFLALINLQVGTLHAVGTSKNMMQAVNLAEHFIETLKSEALGWNMDATVMVTQQAKFPHLSAAGNAVAGGGSGWLQAYKTQATDKRVGPMGNNVVWDSGAIAEIPTDWDQKFCVHYNLTWVVPNYLLRADVRVLWLRDNARVGLYQDCRAGVGIETDLANLASITLPGTIMRNVFSQ